MKQKRFFVDEGKSEQVAGFGKLIVSLKDIDTVYNHDCSFLVGCPGLQNVEHRAGVGGAVLFETPTSGILEVRVFSVENYRIEFLVSQVSPQMGIVGGFVDEDPNNLPFSAPELVRIAESIDGIKSEISKRLNIAPEKLDLIMRKLDEIENASQRLGRKDWINYVMGTLTGLCMQIALPPESAKILFHTVGSAISWLFNNASITLLRAYPLSSLPWLKTWSCHSIIWLTFRDSG